MVAGSTGDDGVPPVIAKVTEQLQVNGCEVSHEVNLEKRRLAYPIKHERYAYYRLVEFSAEPSAVAKLNETFRLTQDILRHLIVEKPVKSAATIEREQALRTRLAARRQQRAVAAGVAEEAAAESATPAMSAEELDEKLSRIVDEAPLA